MQATPIVNSFKEINITYWVPRFVILNMSMVLMMSSVANSPAKFLTILVSVDF